MTKYGHLDTVIHENIDVKNLKHVEVDIIILYVFIVKTLTYVASPWCTIWYTLWFNVMITLA